jgi:outer membrane protein assembly factor BamB/predicted Ser/Thr protein kinase
MGMRPLGSADPDAIASYRLIGVLGGGGMGRVYLGQSPAGRRVAIKVIRADLAQDPVFRRRFAREVAAVRSVSPLFTAPVVDADPDAEAPWLATTYIDGPSLGSWVREHGPMPPGAVLTLGAGLAEALSSIHRAGLVHRDLKPSNILLDDNGPHIIDFGIALSLDATRLTTSSGLGTPSYMAPECLEGDEVGPAGDVFSLGATLFFAATGRSLVDEGTVYAQITQITRGRFDLSPLPRELRPVVLGCISHRAKDRPSADELTRAFVDAGVAAPQPGWQGSDSTPTRPVHPPVPSRLPRRRLLVLAGVLGAGAVAGATGGVLRGLDAGRTNRGPVRARSAALGRRSDGPGSVRWQARSGVRPFGAVLGSGDPGTRVLVDADSRIIAVQGSEVYAVDLAGQRLWTRQFSGAVPGLRRWGDGVLVVDAARLYLLDGATGKAFFGLDLVEAERAAWGGSPPADRPIEIHRIEVLPGRAFVNLGTAIVAVDRTGRRVWRNPVPVRPDGRRGTSPDPLVVDPTRLVTIDVLDQVVQVGLYDAGTGKRRWTSEYDSRAAPNAPPPPGGGPGPDGGRGPGGGPGRDPAWDRIEGCIGETYVVWRHGQQLQVLALADGRGAWRNSSPTPVTAIEVLGPLLLVAADRLTGYTVDTGRPLWQVNLRGARIAALADRGVVAVTEQTICAVDRGGNVRWQVDLPDPVVGAKPGFVTVERDTAYLTFHAPDDRDEPLDVDVLAIALEPVS